MVALLMIGANAVIGKMHDQFAASSNVEELLPPIQSIYSTAGRIYEDVGQDLANGLPAALEAAAHDDERRVA